MPGVVPGAHLRLDIRPVQPVKGVVVEFDTDSRAAGTRTAPSRGSRAPGVMTSSAEFHGWRVSQQWSRRGRAVATWITAARLMPGCEWECIDSAMPNASQNAASSRVRRNPPR